MPPEKQKENPLNNFPSLQTGYFEWERRITKKYWLNFVWFSSFEHLLFKTLMHKPISRCVKHQTNNQLLHYGLVAKIMHHSNSK